MRHRTPFGPALFKPLAIIRDGSRGKISMRTTTNGGEHSRSIVVEKARGRFTKLKIVCDFAVLNNKYLLFPKCDWFLRRGIVLTGATRDKFSGKGDGNWTCCEVCVKMHPDVSLTSIWGRGRTIIADYCVIFACLMLMTSATIMGDECDWTGRYEDYLFIVCCQVAGSFTYRIVDLINRANQAADFRKKNRNALSNHTRNGLANCIA